MATPDDIDPLGHTATVAARSEPREETVPRRPVCDDIRSDDHDLAELPVIDPATYVFGRYFARGGMGRIAEVRDKRLGRVVAIKELIANDPGLVSRFKREIRITARLQHPAIVSMIEAGQWPTGELFFAMKLIPGQSLKHVIAERTTLDERLGLLTSVIAIVDALAYAHEHGIIHRDLKPANVLVGDWGLAKDLRAVGDDDGADPALADGPAEMTLAGSVLGTPAYMAPEQARGGEVDERADVYSLGVILYTVLAGAPPYDDPEPAQVLERVLREPPATLGERQPGVPDDLQAIVSRAMARDPAARYPSAKLLAADLKRFQTGQLVAAHKYTRAQLVRRWLRRHRTAILVGLAAAIVLVVTGTASVAGIIRERDRARAAEREASARADALVIAQAHATIASQPLQALRSLAELPLASEQWPAARMIATTAADAGLPRVVVELGKEDFLVSPDGRMVAIARPDFTLWVVEVETGRARSLGAHAGPIHDIAFSPTGDRLVTTSQDNTVIVWNTAGGMLRTFRGHEGWGIDVSFSPTGDRVVSTGLDRKTRIWSLTGDAVQVLAGTRGDRTFSADGTLMAGSDNQRVAVVDVRTGETKLELEASRGALSPDGALLATVEQGRFVHVHGIAKPGDTLLGDAREALSRLAFTPSGTQVVTAADDGTVQVWDLAGKTSWTYRQTVDPIVGLAQSRDGAWTAVWTATSVHLIDMRAKTGRLLPGANGAARFTVDGARVITGDARNRMLAWPTGGKARVLAASPTALELAVSADGKRLATGGPGWAVRTYELPSGAIRDLAGHTNRVRHVAFSPNGALLASLDASKEVRLWELASGRSVKLPGRAAAMVRFSPDGNHLAAPADTGGLHIWNVATGNVRTFSGGATWIASVAFSPDSRSIVSTASDGTVALWSVETGQGRVLGNHARAQRAIFAPDGATIATAGEADTIGLFAVAGGEPRTAMLAGHGEWVYGLAFSPDGRTLASGGADRTVRVWDVATGIGRVLGRHEEMVREVAFSPDGLGVASGSVDGAARLWSLASPEHRNLDGHRSWLSDLKFLPDGSGLATLGHDGTIRLWGDDLPRDPAGLQTWLLRATSPATPATPALPR